MKTIYIIFFTLLIASGIHAQTNGINYKAIVKDNTGAVIANDLIQVEFAILQGVAQTIVYTENHTPTTDANGLIILNIGEGTLISGDFTIIDWGSDDHFLNVKINTGAGLVDMGTTEFKSVPYALQADKAANVFSGDYGDLTNAPTIVLPTGLEALDEGAGVGFRIIGKDPVYFGNIGANAVDLSHSVNANETSGATGHNSFAVGEGATASGSNSTSIGTGTLGSGIYANAMGYDTIASGFFSTAFGDATEASGNYSTAMGKSTNASGVFSVAMGYFNTAPSRAETTIGSYSTNYTPIGPVSWEPTDRLFTIGNGPLSSSRSDALIILKNGTITAPSFHVSEITDNKALITKEYADANYNDSGTDAQTLFFDTYYDLTISNGNLVNLYPLANTGLEAIDEGGGQGWRLVGVDPNEDSYGQIGIYGVDLSYNDSNSNEYGATSENTFAAGYNTKASEINATAFGNETVASGHFSTSFGRSTTASGSNSTAMGTNTSATGFYTTSMGEYTNANSKNSFAVGRSNIGGGDPTTWVETDPLFEIGNGTPTIPSNALTVLKNGTITAPSFDISEITDSKALITKEYADINYNDSGTDTQTLTYTSSNNDLEISNGNIVNLSGVNSGLEALDEGNGLGFRIKGKNPAFYGDLGLRGIDLSFYFQASDVVGATGNTSFALGFGTIASGTYSSTFGYSTIASASSTMAAGSFTEASGHSSAAFGRSTHAEGNNSMALGDQANAVGLNTLAAGYRTQAESYSSAAFGVLNVGGGDPLVWNPTDPLFEVGNGVLPTRTNALTILKNGTITAPTFDISEITDNKALITKEYADANYNEANTDAQTLTFDTNTNDLSILNGNTVNLDGISSGLEAINEGNGVGYRLKDTNPANYGNIGLDAVDLSYNFLASSTRGATGQSSTAMGFGTTASGQYSFAMGSQTTASTLYTTSMGVSTMASGHRSTAMGDNTISHSYGEMAIGRFNSNYTPVSISGWNSNDRLFVVGNGSSTTKSNALTILKNGKVGITTATPDTRLHITGGGDANLSNGSGYLVMGNVNGANMVFDENEIIARNNGANGPLYLQNTGGNVAIGAVVPSVALDIVGSIEYTGTITDVSDRRLKENFEPIDDVLARLQKIEGITYNMKDDEDEKREYGVIAQELQKVFPEMVSVIDKENGYLGVSYIQLVPVLLEAIKEQQDVIANRTSRIEVLEAKLSEKETELSRMNSRISRIEGIISN